MSAIRKIIADDGMVIATGSTRLGAVIHPARLGRHVQWACHVRLHASSAAGLTVTALPIVHP
jgi:hypothetical protein